MSYDPETRFRRLDPEERKAALEGLAMRYGNEDYAIDLTPEQTQKAERDFTLNAFKAIDLKAEANEIAKRYRALIGDLIQQNKTLRKEIETGRRELNGTLYYVDDQDKNRMYIYDANGELVRDRRLQANERQTRILPMMIRTDTPARTGTDD